MNHHFLIIIRVGTLYEESLDFVARDTEELQLTDAVFKLFRSSIIDRSFTEASRHDFHIATRAPELNVKIQFLLLAKVEECNRLVRLKRLGAECSIAITLPIEKVLLGEALKLLGRCNV